MDIIKLLKTKKEDFWINEGRKRALALFHDASRRVPAYKDFLTKNKINPEKIKNWNDFKLVPLIDKKNYLKKYPLEKLCWDGTLKKPMVFCATSGSTGEPFYSPRNNILDWQYSVILESFVKNGSYYKGKDSTLVVICFGMGVWIGGVITYQAFEMLSHRDNSISIITPGINKAEIFNALKKLAPNFKETILVGYPPFIKDIIDEAPSHGINFKKLNTRLIFAAEGITEKFRDYLVQKAGIKNLYLDTLNIYGSADIGAMAYETSISILIKRLALANKKLFESIFSNIHNIPTLAQFNPLFINFESSNGEILLTGNNTLPLIRYAIGDHGGILSFNEMVSNLNSFNIDLSKRAKISGIIQAMHHLPFVYVYERTDFSTNFYGAIIHAEHIKQGIENRLLGNFLTEKFTMETKNDARQNQYLEINLELKPNIKKSAFLEKTARVAIVHSLLKRNSEYNNNYNMMREKVVPKLIFWPNNHPRYFKSGVKQKWVKK